MSEERRPSADEIHAEKLPYPGRQSDMRQPPDSDRQRADTLEAARLRVALAEAQREAERARQAERETPVYLAPGWGWRGPQVRPGRPWPRPAPVRPSPDRRWPSVGG